MTWSQILGKLLARENLTRSEASWAMGEMMSGKATDAQIAGFLLALRSKGEIPEEISGFVDVMLQNSVKVPVSDTAVDIVGTGGDQLGTLNISSMAAIVAAATGYPVLKHGSRSASGKTGSSEFLEALGINLSVSPERLAQIFDQLGIGFFFAPLFHPALKNVAQVRKELGVPTTFNVLGPLANPVQPIATALGVANKTTLPLIVGDLVNRGRTALVFRGEDGLDELTTTGPSQLYIISAQNVQEVTFDPESLGIKRTSLKSLIGGNPEQNAQIAMNVFSATEGESPVTDIVCLNAAAAMTAFDLALNQDFSFKASMTENYQRAHQALLEGKVKQKLDSWVEESHR